MKFRRSIDDHGYKRLFDLFKRDEKYLLSIFLFPYITFSWFHTRLRTTYVFLFLFFTFLPFFRTPCYFFPFLLSDTDDFFLLWSCLVVFRMCIYTHTHTHIHFQTVTTYRESLCSCFYVSFVTRIHRTFIIFLSYGFVQFVCELS